MTRRLTYRPTRWARQAAPSIRWGRHRRSHARGSRGLPRSGLATPIWVSASRRTGFVLRPSSP